MSYSVLNDLAGSHEGVGRKKAVTIHPHRHDNRAVANTTRYPEGGTSRAPTGPDGTRGPIERAGRAGERSKERASHAEATPHTKSKDEQSNRGKRTAKTKANRNPTFVLVVFWFSLLLFVWLGFCAVFLNGL